MIFGSIGLNPSLGPLPRGCLSGGWVYPKMKIRVYNLYVNLSMEPINDVVLQRKGLRSFGLYMNMDMIIIHR